MERAIPVPTEPYHEKRKNAAKNKNQTINKTKFKNFLKTQSIFPLVNLVIDRGGGGGGERLIL